MTTFVNHLECSGIVEMEECPNVKGIEFENGFIYNGEYFREDGITWFVVVKNGCKRVVNVSPTTYQRG